VAPGAAGTTGWTEKTTPPAAVNFTALARRLKTTWRRRLLVAGGRSAGDRAQGRFPDGGFLAGAGGEDAFGAGGEAGEIEIRRVQFEAAGLDFGEVEDVVDEGE